VIYTLFQLTGTTLLPVLKMKKTDFVVYHAEMGLWASLLGKVRFPGARHIYYCYQPPRELYDLRAGTKEQFGSWYYLLFPLLELYKIVDRWLVRRMDLVLVWSPEYEEYARAIYGDLRISQVPAAVDFDFIQDIGDREERIGEFRRKYAIDDSPVLLTVSALNWKKNLHILVKLVAGLLEKNITVQGVIVGEGPERTNLEELAEQFGIRQHLLITGYVPQEELPLFYHVADIVYFLEPNAAWTMSTIEAGAASKPVITASGGSMKTLVLDGVSGVIIPDIENADHLLKVSRELLGDDKKLRELGKKNLEHSRQFSLEATTRRFISAVMEL
jgi:glycosyltransferase involved in cell wall biosynthesis